MSGSTFIDNNVLVYACDTYDPAKQDRAQQILRDGIAEENAALSAQVLGEFITVVTRRIPMPLSVEEAEHVLNFLSILPAVKIDA